MSSKWKAGILTAALMMSPMVSVYAGPKDGGQWDNGGHSRIRHVLLISIDGMHAVDFINCVNGVKGANGGAPYCPNLAELKETGIDYLGASTSKTSDSFPGLTAIVSGGSPRTEGAYYDVAYDRSLDPPAKTTGNGVAGDPSFCTPGAAPIGTRSEYEEGIDLDQSQLNGGAPAGVDGGYA
ncbi:MAG: alkaline phosphatase family protein, partial [Candidatus Acidiferrales bacterium]